MGSRALCGRWFAMSGLEASMKLKILAIVALGVVGIGAAFVALGGLPASASATTQYLTGAVTTGDVSDDVAATGTMATTASYGLSFGSPAHVAGATASAASTGTTTWTVTAVKTAVGDTVKAGQILATASTTDLQRDLANARSALNSAAIQLAIAQDSVDAATTTDQTRQATMSLNNAQTQVTNAHQTVNDLLDQIRLATLKSPIDGVVTTVAITKGLSAPSGDAIVIDSTALQVTADVAETDVASISVGQLASVTVSAVSEQLTGKVTAIAPTAAAASTNGSVVSYPVTISVTGAPKTVRAGMTASVTITIDSATNVLTVPSAALRGTAGNYSVLIMNATGEPTAQAVQVGLVTNTTAEIKSGLTEGQRVVTGVNTAQTGTPTTGNGFGGGFGGGFQVGGGANRRGVGN
jgi:RND family efflux transporter MFP subunit